MSHRDQILRRLEQAGQRGVHSFQLLDITPRYAARICELNKLGHVITSEPERRAEAIGVRYTLNVGVGAEGSESVSGFSRSGSASQSAISTDSGVAASVPISRPSGGTDAPPAESLFDLPPAPSAFDPWERAA